MNYENIELIDYVTQAGTKGVDVWDSAMLLYNSAMKEMRTKVDILNDEFKHVHQYNPIEYVKNRIKSPESIVKKLKRYGYTDSIENMVLYCNDIAGIRIVCSFTSDIYAIADMIGRQNDITVISIKDYIKNPKPSGYRSFHMIVSVPIFLSDKVVNTKVEIQIRTIAMDFWASLEHKIQYKFEGNVPEQISTDLWECSDIVNMLDNKMLSLNDAVMQTKIEMDTRERIQRRVDAQRMQEQEAPLDEAETGGAEVTMLPEEEQKHTA